MTSQGPHHQNPFSAHSGPGRPGSSGPYPEGPFPPPAPPKRKMGDGTAWVLALVTPLVLVLGGYGLLYALFGVDDTDTAVDPADTVVAADAAPAHEGTTAAPRESPRQTESATSGQPSESPAHSATAAATSTTPDPVAPAPGPTTTDSGAPVSPATPEAPEAPEAPEQDFTFTAPGTVARYQLGAMGPFDSSRQCAEAALGDLESGKALVGTSIADVCYENDGPTNHQSGLGFYYDVDHSGDSR